MEAQRTFVKVSELWSHLNVNVYEGISTTLKVQTVKFFICNLSPSLPPSQNTLLL